MFYALILAGGSGNRMGSFTPKQFMPVSGIPVIVWSLRAFQSLDEIAGIVVACPKEYIPTIKSLAAEYRITKLNSVTAGGKTRQHSSWNALQSRSFSDDDIVLIHDAARPFVSGDLIRSCAKAAKKTGAASAYVLVKDTIAEVRDDFVLKNLSRESLRAAQTPQAFRYSIIRAAHNRAKKLGIEDATDDVSLVLEMGQKICAVEGSPHNIKITTPEDLAIAEIIALNLQGKHR